MSRLFTCLLTLLVCWSVLAADEQPVITTAAGVESFIQQRPSYAIRDFRLSCTVLRTDRDSRTFVVQDPSGQQKIHSDLPDFPSPGDRLIVTGTVDVNRRQEFQIIATGIRKTGHEAPYQPIEIPLSALDEEKHNLLAIRTTGTAVDVVADEVDDEFVFLMLKDGDTVLPVSAPRERESQLTKLIGARLRIFGTIERHVFGARRFFGPMLSPIWKADDCLTVLEPAPTDPFAAPPLENSYYLTQREIARLGLRTVVGTVVAAWNGSNVMVKTDDERVVSVLLARDSPLPSCGKRVAAVGYPVTDLFRLSLSNASWKETSGRTMAPEAPLETSADEILSNQPKCRAYTDDRFQGALIRLVGTVSALSAGGSPGFNLESGPFTLPVDCSYDRQMLTDLTVGCRVEVTGRCQLQRTSHASLFYFPQVTGMSVIIGHEGNIRILSRPPWLTPFRLMIILAALLCILFGFVLWNRILAHLVAVRSRQLFKAELTQATTELKIGERTRLAVELHDTLSQNLTGIALAINAGEYDLAKKSLKSCREELKNCLWDLRNDALEEADLDEAIRRTLSPHLGDAKLLVRFNLSRRQLTDKTTHAILRILRELAVNAVRHGQATELRVAGSVEEHRILFSLRDNGCGFDPERAPGMDEGHFGLQGIRERVENMNGEMTIDSSPDKGTKVTIWLKSKC